MKKIEPSAFELYRDALGESDAEKLSRFFDELDAHNALPRSEAKKLRGDFESALLCYADAGVSLDEALERLDVAHLGGFYSRPPVRWFPLDDAAKIYPLSMKHGQMAVFRLSVYFRRPVVPELLQMALDFTIKRFPSFATTVKKGFFWHYLDASKRRYSIEPESGRPCRPLSISGSGSQSFRVVYYGNRVSAEYFHILTDGTGGMAFLKSLTAEYLRLCGVRAKERGDVLDADGVPSAQETANEFSRADRTDSNSGFVDRPALQMTGRLSRARPCRVLHFKMDAATLRETAKKKNTTVTAYILAQMFVAGKFATDEPEGDISIQVPVNMRKFYPSDTVRNFSMYCGIRLPVSGIGDAGGLYGEISRQLEEKASRRSMSEMMNSTEHMVGLLCHIPLFVKAPAAKAVYGFLGDKIFSNTLSNLGVVDMPPELAAQVDCMDFVLGTCITNRAGCAMVTFGKTATLSITKMTADPSFEDRLLALLSADGLAVTVEGSPLYES